MALQAAVTAPPGFLDAAIAAGAVLASSVDVVLAQTAASPLPPSAGFGGLAVGALGAVLDAGAPLATAVTSFSVQAASGAKVALSALAAPLLLTLPLLTRDGNCRLQRIAAPDVDEPTSTKELHQRSGRAPNVVHACLERDDRGHEFSKRIRSFEFPGRFGLERR